MDNVTASIIIACQTAGAVNSISKLGFALSMLGRQAIAFGRESIQVFSDLQEETQKFGTVFAGVQNQANESIKDLMENYGQSELSARRMMAQVGDLLKGTGMSQQDIAAISGEVSKLGSDLTSFANYSGGAEQATFALVKAMLGETEMAKSLGVFIKTDTEEFKKLEKQARTSGIYIEQFGQTFKASTTVQARAYASLATMFDQKGYVLGDFSRNIDSIANQSRVLENNISELKTTVGGFLNNILGVGSIKKDASETISGITKSIAENSTEWAYYVASFVNEFRAGMEIIGSISKNSFSNFFSAGKYFIDSLTFLFTDFENFFSALMSDLGHALKMLLKNMALSPATLTSLLIGEITVDDIFQENAEDIGKLFKETEKYLAGKGLKSGEYVDPLADLNRIIDNYNKRQIEINARRGKSYVSGEDDIPSANQALAKEISKAANLFQQTAQSATFAGSLEAARLQSRMMLGASGINLNDNPQKTTAEQSKKQVALLEELRTRLDSIITGIDGISTQTV